MQFRDVAVSTPVGNPLDTIEQIVVAESWPFDRTGDDELNISVSGQWSDYQLTFNWREDLEALHLACAFDVKVPESKRTEVYTLLALINEQMWIGHFDLWSDEGVILFRHGVLMHGGAVATVEQCEAMVRLSVEACERYFPAFQFVLWAGKTAAEAISSCMFDVEGTA
ncbi:MAG: YbjN domain-containing protein [Alphaproteobacteria bacterium]